MNHSQTCMVRECADLADTTWTDRSGWRDWNVEWHVCATHLGNLDRGETWAPHYGHPPDWTR